MGSWTNLATPPPACSNELMNTKSIKESKNGRPHRAFTLIEMIGALTILAILATFLVPALMQPVHALSGVQLGFPAVLLLLATLRRALPPMRKGAA